MDNSLCFTYGSNLNPADLAKWASDHNCEVPRLERVGPAFLPDRALVFPRESTRRKGGVLGYADAVGSTVEGVVFRVKSERDWQLLDRKEDEGPNRSYTKELVDLIDKEGNLFKAWSYRANPQISGKHYPPNASYLEVVRKGYAEQGIDTHSLEAAARNGLAPVQDGLFCYGTLMRGQSRFECLQRFGIDCCLLAETSGLLVDLGSYPGMIPADGPGKLVQGEFFRLRDARAALETLDEIEGFRGYGREGSLYHRTLIPVHVGDCRVRLAWTYRLANPRREEPLIVSGDWREHQQVREEFLRGLARLHADARKKADEASLLSNRPGASDSRSNPRFETLDLEAEFKGLLAGRISERDLVKRSGIWNAGC